MNHILNSGEFNIEAENACASLLTQFNSNYIYDICNHSLLIKDQPSINEAPNIVNACEFSFKQLKEMFSIDAANIDEVRDRTYMEIIDRLCKFYDADFIDPGDEYHYLLARNMYYFLCSGYVRCLIKFMSHHIYKNRNELYETLNIVDAKKSKDTSTVYNRKIYKQDQKLGLIIANIDTVINYILGQDIPFEEILDYIFMDKDLVYTIHNSFKFRQDFFNFYKATMNTMFRPSIISNIVLQLQSHYANTLEI